MDVWVVAVVLVAVDEAVVGGVLLWLLRRMLQPVVRAIIAIADMNVLILIFFLKLFELILYEIFLRV